MYWLKKQLKVFKTLKVTAPDWITTATISILETGKYAYNNMLKAISFMRKIIKNNIYKQVTF